MATQEEKFAELEAKRVAEDREIAASVRKREKDIKTLIAAFVEAKFPPPDEMTPQEREVHDQIAQQIAAMERQNQIERARIDFNAFAEFVVTDDETGEKIRQAPIHKRWAELCAQHKFLLIWSHINSGKTTQLSIVRTVWELGRDPTLRFAILSNTIGIAQKILKAISHYIKENEDVKCVFPKLIPNEAGPWTNSEIQVQRPGNAKDPSVRAVGVHGALTSARVDRLVVDDILDPENCETEAQRKKLIEWYNAVAVGRLTRRAKVLVVGTAYHPQDLLHVLSKKKGWKWVRFPVITASGAIAWPDFWPRDRIDQMKEQLGPAEFARQLLCKARDDDESRFKQDWIDMALKKGNGKDLIHHIEELTEKERDGLTVWTGVDLAIKKTKKADKTAFFTFGQYPNGHRRLFAIKSGKYTGPEIIEYLIDVWERLGGVIAVENNAAQDYILQFAREQSLVPVMPHTTTKKKRDPVLGVEGLAIELANGKWEIPNQDNITSKEVGQWIEDMLFYTPQAHPGDILMACYFARELARTRLGDKSVPTVAVRTFGGKSDIKPQEQQKSTLQQLFDVPSG